MNSLIPLTKEQLKDFYNDPFIKAINKELIHIHSIALPEKLIIHKDRFLIESVYSKKVQKMLDQLYKHRKDYIDTHWRKEEKDA